jgi:hypothetical protein
MNLRLATGDYSFPKLEWEQTLRLARDIGMEGIDIALRGPLAPDPRDVLASPSTAPRVLSPRSARGFEIADVSKLGARLRKMPLIIPTRQ